MYGGSDPTRIAAAERTLPPSTGASAGGTRAVVGDPRGALWSGRSPEEASRPPGPVAFAGEPGAFAEDALLAFFGHVERVALPTFRSVFAAVTAGEAAAGVLPIENLVNGTVRENYDLLLEHDLVIGGEVVVPVRLCLAALPGERLEGIERVYSHLQAIGQAERFLRSRPWQLLTTYNTAGAGRLIAERGERGAAAVLSPRAASLFGLEVLVPDVADVPDNRTRFLVVARPDDGACPAWLAARAEQVAAVRGRASASGAAPAGVGVTPAGAGVAPPVAEVPPADVRAAPAGPATAPAGPATTAAGPVTAAVGPATARVGPVTTPVGPVTTPVGPVTTPAGSRAAGPDPGEAAPGPVPMRTTLVLAVENVPGALLRVLAVFAERGLNMSKLESRPSRERAWEYVFWVDLDGALHADEPEGADTLAALHRVTTMCRILGVYPSGEA